MSVWEDLAEDVAEMIEEAGVMVRVGDAHHPAIIDPQAESVARIFGQEVLETVAGRPAVFYFLPDADLSVSRFLWYDGEDWTLQPVRPVEGGVRQCQVVLASAGATR